MACPSVGQSSMNDSNPRGHANLLPYVRRIMSSVWPSSRRSQIVLMSVLSATCARPITLPTALSFLIRFLLAVFFPFHRNWAVVCSRCLAGRASAVPILTFAPFALLFRS